MTKLNSAPALLPGGSDGAAFLAGETAVAVQVRTVERLQAKLGRLGERDAAVIVGVDPVEAALAEPGEKAAALAAPLEAMDAAFAPAFGAQGTALAPLCALGALARREEFGAADLAVPVGVETGETILAPVLPGLVTVAANRAAESLRFGLSDVAVAVGVDACELGADAALNVGTGDARAAIEAAAGLLREAGGHDQGRRGGAEENKLFHLDTPQERHLGELSRGAALYRR
jgi:hypothetical protein